MFQSSGTGLGVNQDLEGRPSRLCFREAGLLPFRYVEHRAVCGSRMIRVCWVSKLVRFRDWDVY